MTESAHQLIGHARALDVLNRLQTNGRLGSALLIVGANGVGKRALVEIVFGSLATNPNAMVIERALNDKDELKKNISIDQVRDLVARMGLSTFGTGKKIGLIDGAEFLSMDASNALLKTLEDPTGDTLMILLATSTQTIPATVLSRCQTIYLPLVARAEIVRALTERGASATVANEIAESACGRPGLALRLLQNPELLAQRREQAQQVKQLISAPLAVKLGRIGEYTKADKAELEATLDTWETTLHADGQHLLLKKLIRARAAIRQNVHPTLALEHAFL